MFREGCAGFCCVSDGSSEDRDEDQGSREKSVVSLSHQALQIESQLLGRERGVGIATRWLAFMDF